MRFFLLALFGAVACTTSKPTSVEAPSVEVPAVEAVPESAKETNPHAASKMMIAGDLSFITVKNGDLPVAASLVGFAGQAEAGPVENGVMTLSGTLEVPLSAWTTQLEIRDQRILETFFGAEANPVAFFKLKRMSHPAPGTAGMWIDGTLEIGPFSQDVRGHFRATSGKDGTQNLESGEAMIVSIAQLGMGDRLASLISLCGHKSVDDSVEVRATGTIRFADQ
jgi:hypothetical protein